LPRETHRAVNHARRSATLPAQKEPTAKTEHHAQFAYFE
jgi:hypothetical protein